MLDLSISLINHSNPEMLHECLRSLYATTQNISFEIWVVDNATDKRGVAEMQAEFPDVKWLFNEKRQGFSANHNQVLERIVGEKRARYACILNDDTTIHPGAFETLVRYLDAHSAVGMVGARLLNTDGSPQDCVFRYPTVTDELIQACILPGGLNRLKRRVLDPAQDRDAAVNVDWVLGACIVVRTEVLEKIGLLDNRLSPIVYMEEVDWCYRTRKAGWAIAFVPQAVITHHGGQSTKATKPGADPMRLELYRTHITYFRKHHGLFAAWLVRGIFVGTLPWNLLMLTQGVAKKTIPRTDYERQAATFKSAAHLALTWRGDRERLASFALTPFSPHPHPLSRSGRGEPRTKR
jgi:N-acetylglucosaminyl-diphospho-decaprenol L-rhamnosyltransferase